MTPWDAGVRWSANVTDGPAMEPLTVPFVRDSHLRGVNGADEDEYIASLIAAARHDFEGFSQRLVGPQTVTLVMDRFPCAVIELPYPPLRSVTSIRYVDEDGVTQTMSGSPEEFLVSAPRGPRARRGCISPLYDETWPTTRCQMDAVTVTYQAGYDVAPGADVIQLTPEPILHGMLLVIGELFKVRSLSVHAFNQSESVVRARSLWSRFRVF